MTGTLRFSLDGRPVDADAFRLAAIDPAASVVVDACAGSGKTTLLVARIVRALLDGAAPDEILAVTFTRLASHEMHERLVKDLRRLALLDDAGLREALAQWYGLGEAGADAALARARGLYESVLSHPRGPEITTFHRWFRTLASIGPLSGASGEGRELTEDGAALLQQAWFEWLDALRGPGREALRADLETLVAAIGLNGARTCLGSMVEQRTDWAVAVDVDLDAPPDVLAEAAARAAEAYRIAWRAEAEKAVGGPVADGDALAVAAARDTGLRDALSTLARMLGRGTASAQKLADTLATLAADAAAGDDPVSARGWLAALAASLTKQDGAQRAWPTSKALEAAIAADDGAEAWNARWTGLFDRVALLSGLLDEWRGVELNAAAMRCGASLLDGFRAAKRRQGVIDFADLETLAWRMLRDPGTAAYVQCRMDRRYRHLLFDEFQDTSSLQWRVIADWLESYAGAGNRPSVFVVGDPKQSIYRFRRAEARVFDAAKTLLREGFGAREASTDTTRRNAPAIVAALNRCLPAWMPHYREQATAAEGPEGFVWRLPLVTAPSDGAADAEPPQAFDWLRSDREDDEPLRHHEGLAIADALLSARAAFAAEGRVLRWSEVMVLARSRTGFEAYERALRERGLPVRSDRLGGLLRTLEGDDLRALLAFVRRPVDDLALAQVLASPLVGLPPAALAWIAARGPAAGPANAAPAADDGATGRDAGMPEDVVSDAFTSEPFASEAFPSEDFAPEPFASEAIPSEAFTSDDIPAPTPSPRRWWPRLRALALDPDPADPPPFDAAALVARLAGWIDLASRVPVHDFLDAALASADAFAAYPAAVDPAQREVAHANLCAMLGLALDVDAGRFPSLARFLRRLRGFDTLDDREGPDEGPAGAADAIRLMTIHGSKGLEADVVVLADAHGRAQPDGQRLHVDWSPVRPRPSMVSFHLGSAFVGRARDESFAREAMLREREDRNLLYVALTRAKVGLVVTGTRNKQSPKSSWYTVLDGIESLPQSAMPTDASVSADGAAAPASPGRFELPLLDLPPLSIGTRRDPGEGADERDDDGRPAGLLATELGHALHRALELLPVGADDATVLAAMHGFALDAAQRRAALARARAVTGLAPLRPALDPAAPSACEFEIVGADGEIRRIDRIARVGDEVWIVDYKWSVDARRRPDYIEQLAGYRALVAALEPPPFGAVVGLRTVLVDAGSGRVEFDVDLRPSTDGASPGPETAG